jgi:hypothetical protein
MNLLEPPGAVLDDPETVEHAEHTREILAAKQRRPRAVSRGELVDAIATATPVT